MNGTITRTLDWACHCASTFKGGHAMMVRMVLGGPIVRRTLISRGRWASSSIYLNVPCE